MKFISHLQDLPRSYCSTSNSHHYKVCIDISGYCLFCLYSTFFQHLQSVIIYITLILTGECTLKAATRSHLVSDDTPTSRVANTKLLENEFWGTVHQRYIFTLNPTKLTLILLNLAIKISLSLSRSSLNSVFGWSYELSRIS